MRQLTEGDERGDADVSNLGNRKWLNSVVRRKGKRKRKGTEALYPQGFR